MYYGIWQWKSAKLNWFRNESVLFWKFNSIFLQNVIIAVFWRYRKLVETNWLQEEPASWWKCGSIFLKIFISVFLEYWNWIWYWKLEGMNWFRFSDYRINRFWFENLAWFFLKISKKKTLQDKLVLRWTSFIIFDAQRLTGWAEYALESEKLAWWLFFRYLK